MANNHQDSGHNPEELQTLLDALQPGPVSDPHAVASVEKALEAAWPVIGSHEEAMEGWKIPGRTAEMSGEPPVLSFVIERHGATKMGLIWAELQTWRLDLDAGTCTCEGGRLRQKHPRNPPVKAGPIAAKIVELVQSKSEDDGLKWPDGETRLWIMLARFLPSRVPQQTFQGADSTLKRNRGWKVASQGLVR